jgi:YidC/Oxa1 family membrane protein insertase
MNDINNKNFILAIVLSTLIIFAWQYFYAGPLAEKTRVQQQTTQQTQTQTQQQKPTQAAGAGEALAIPRETALAASTRIPIDTPDVKGSINLKGGKIDDLSLNHYRETIQPGSKTIALLSPAGSPNAYFIEHGLVAPQGTAVKLPASDTLWSAESNAVLGIGKPVTLTWDNGEGLTFRRQISIDDQYVFSITQEVSNKTQAPVSLYPFARIQRQDTPKIVGYYVFFEGMLGFLGDKLQEIHYSGVAGAKEPTAIDSTGGWLGFTDQYWGTALVPDQSRAVATRFQHQSANGRDVYQADYTGRDPIVVQSGATGLYQDQLFAGPKVVQTINKIGDKYQIKGFDYMIDWGWFRPITKPMFYLIEFIKSLVGNFGIAILITTVLVKLAVFPLANKSYASMSKMKNLAPEMAKLKELYPDDRMKQQQEMMALYKREKVSPASGCLPVLVQIPIFFALYKVILTSIELRHAPFFGWVHDLSAMDPSNLFTLFGLIDWVPPHFLHLGIWPILMGITMWVQMRLNPTPPDPVQASLFNWMPVIFTYMLASFPAGLVIYWAWSNFLSIIQQSYIMKRHGTEIDLFGNIANSLPFLKKKPAPN